MNGSFPDGCLAGHATHPSGTTGVTVLIFPDGAVAGHFVSGHATGSRELDVLSPLHITPNIHGLCFAGGSVFGLAAADGVVLELADRGIGHPVPEGVVPIVPGAILYDLDGGNARPDSQLGQLAARNATSDSLAEGLVGAGTGAKAARITGDPVPGGVGCVVLAYGEFTVSAMVVVNSLGAIRDPATGNWVAGSFAEEQTEFSSFPFGNTTLVAIVTDVPLTKSQCVLVSRMASAGIARTHVPANTPLDGDIVFAISTGATESQSEVGTKVLTEVGNLAALCVERAIVRSVRTDG
jgi:L-aminopeptidase/D-esterase-like protein